MNFSEAIHHIWRALGGTYIVKLGHKCTLATYIKRHIKRKMHGIEQGTGSGKMTQAKCWPRSGEVRKCGGTVVISQSQKDLRKVRCRRNRHGVEYIAKRYALAWALMVQRLTRLFHKHTDRALECCVEAIEDISLWYGRQGLPEWNADMRQRCSRREHFRFLQVSPSGEIAAPSSRSGCRPNFGDDCRCWRGSVMKENCWNVPRKRSGFAQLCEFSHFLSFELTHSVSL